MLFTKTQRHMNLKAATLGQLVYIARYEDKDAAHMELRRRIALGSYDRTENDFICPGCNRPLRSKKSIAKGIGPVCERKFEKPKNEPDEDQLKMELKEKK